MNVLVVKQLVECQRGLLASRENGLLVHCFLGEWFQNGLAAAACFFLFAMDSSRVDCIWLSVYIV